MKKTLAILLLCALALCLSAGLASAFVDPSTIEWKFYGPPYGASYDSWLILLALYFL